MLPATDDPDPRSSPNGRNPAVWTGQWGLSSGLERLAWGRGPTALHPLGRARGETAHVPGCMRFGGDKHLRRTVV